MRVVLDTNTVVSALLFPHGRLAWIRHFWAEGRIMPLISQDAARELIRVLTYPKFGLSGDDIQATLAAYLPFAETVAVAGRVAADCPRCRDEDDQMFIELGVAGKAEVLVTGDAALFDLQGSLPFVVETAADFALRFR